MAPWRKRIDRPRLLNLGSRRAAVALASLWWALSVAALLSITIVPVFGQAKTGESAKAHAQTQSAPGVYETVVAGKSCKEDEKTQSLNCEYKVGTGLHFLIEGLGQPDTAISFLKSSADEDFFASFATFHGCIVVARGQKSGLPAGTPDFAFVSPRHGKVYKSWEECKEGW